MTLKEIVEKVIEEKNDFHAIIFVLENKYIIDLEEGELLIEAYHSTDKDIPKYSPGNDLVINDWDEDDWNEFQTWTWPVGDVRIGC